MEYQIQDRTDKAEKGFEILITKSTIPGGKKTTNKKLA